MKLTTRLFYFWNSQGHWFNSFRAARGSIHWLTLSVEDLEKVLHLHQKEDEQRHAGNATTPPPTRHPLQGLYSAPRLIPHPCHELPSKTSDGVDDQPAGMNMCHDYCKRNSTSNKVTSGSRGPQNSRSEFTALSARTSTATHLPVLRSSTKLEYSGTTFRYTSRNSSALFLKHPFRHSARGDVSNDHTW